MVLLWKCPPEEGLWRSWALFEVSLTYIKYRNKVWSNWDWDWTFLALAARYLTKCFSSVWVRGPVWRRQAWDQQLTLAVWLFSLLIHPAGLLPTSSEQATGASIEVWSFCFMLWNSTAGQQLLSLLWGELRVVFFQCEQRTCWEQKIQTPEWLHRAKIAVISALQTFHVINRLALNWKCVLVSTWWHCSFLFLKKKRTSIK